MGMSTPEDHHGSTRTREYTYLDLMEAISEDGVRNCTVGLWCTVGN